MKNNKRNISLAIGKLCLPPQNNPNSLILRFPSPTRSNITLLSAIAVTLLPTFTNTKFLNSGAAFAQQAEGKEQQKESTGAIPPSSYLLRRDCVRPSYSAWENAKKALESPHNLATCGNQDYPVNGYLVSHRKLDKLARVGEDSNRFSSVEKTYSQERVAQKISPQSNEKCISSLLNWMKECSVNSTDEGKLESLSQQTSELSTTTSCDDNNCTGLDLPVNRTVYSSSPQVYQKRFSEPVSPVNINKGNINKESISTRLKKILQSEDDSNTQKISDQKIQNDSLEQTVQEESVADKLIRLDLSNSHETSKNPKVQLQSVGKEKSKFNVPSASTSDPLNTINFDAGVHSSQLPSTELQTQNSGDTTGTVQSQKKTKNKFNLDIAPIGNPQVQADGRSTIKIRGTVSDENGELVNEDIKVTLTSSAGLFIGADQSKDQPGFQVIARGGEFIANLRSGIKPQQVRIRGALNAYKKRSPEIREEIGTLSNPSFPQQTDTNVWNNFSDQRIEAYTQVEFTTYLRPSLVTGIINFRIGARGTDYWGSRSEFLRPGESGTEFDVDAAVFATGKIGEWLFTGAYNSERPLNQDCEGRNRLFGGVQFCEQKYPVYGDSSTFTSTAPSIDSVYAKIERSPGIPGAEPDYFMWGDYNTKEFSRASQLYTATSRQLHGFKGNYSIGKLQITGLFANNIEGFQRDTFIPNGTSGNYFLSKRLIVPGSEIVYLESEEINRPGTVVERKQLYRGQDYQIDYDRGTLLFNRPILSTELSPGFGSTLVRKVVVTYQNDGGEDSDLYAGRLQYNITSDIEKKTFIAASYLREDQGDQDYDLFGADFQISLGDRGRIIGEFARSNSNPITGENVEGNAYRIEAFGKFSDRFEGAAYYRSVEPDFNNNATFSFFPGQTRFGASLFARASENTRFKISYDVEENFGTAATNLISFFDLFDPQPTARPGERVNNELRTFRAGILQKLGKADLGLEYVNRSREDRVNDRFDANADQLVSTLKYPFTDKLVFRAQNEVNLGSSDPLYPNKTTLALDWKAYPGVTFRLAHQFFDRSELVRGNSITTLDTIVDHKFSENTALTGRYSVLSGFNGLQGQGAVGLNHGWAIAPGLKMNLGYQYVFKNIFNATGTGEQFEQYYAVGQTASSLGLFSGSVYSVGFEYTDNPDLKASARFEYRDGDDGDNTVISVAGAGKISPALTALVRFQQAGEANVFLPSSSLNTTGVQFQELGDTANLRIGLAYRNPRDDKFNGLLSYEWRQNFDSTIENQITGTTATGHIFALEGIYAPSWRWEFYGKYAFRNGVTYLDGDRLDGSVNLAQLRSTYRLGYRTDLAVEGRWIGQNSNSGTDYDEFGWAVETGYYVTPDLRVGLGYSFGSIDDRDFSGYRSRGGLYLNVSLKLNELFGGFGLQKPVPRQQQESEITQANRTQVSSDKASSKARKTQSRLIKRLRKGSTSQLSQQTSLSTNKSPKSLRAKSNLQKSNLQNSDSSSIPDTVAVPLTMKGLSWSSLFRRETKENHSLQRSDKYSFEDNRTSQPSLVNSVKKQLSKVKVVP